ncbi:MAG TPA: LamG-like jellyroll fold domain-containing protein [Paludibacter sp.]|nr:LamG-like jellyroll fold domain-containing protein [Paludibacter sp.]
MKSFNLKTILFCIATFTTIFLQSCKNEETPLEETELLAKINTNLEMTDITAVTATSGGEIITDNGFTVTQRGVCWSTKIDPTINDSLSKDGSGAGKFTSILRNLTPNTSYYVRAYAINSKGVSYGSTLNFTTDNGVVLVEAKLLTDTTATSIVCKTDFKSFGGLNVISKGICWGKNATPTIEDNVLINNHTTGIYTDTIINLTPKTQYFLRAFVTTVLGTVYSNELIFTTKDQIPLNGLIAWYPFNGNANDESGNGNNGTNHGCTNVSDRFGKTDNAFLFNGSNNDVRLDLKSINNTFGQGVDLTVNTWIKTSDLNGPILTLRDNNTVFEFNVGCLTNVVNSPGKVGVMIRDDATALGTGNYIFSKSVNDNSWHMITLVRLSSSGIIKIFIDGVLDVTSVNGQGGSLTFNKSYMSIGSEQNWIQTNFETSIDQKYFSGAIDDLGIWNQALTQSEITALFNMK